MHLASAFVPLVFPLAGTGVLMGAGEYDTGELHA
jgi:hypothetical protein